MKLFQAKYKNKKSCCYCGKNIKKHDHYYRQRRFYPEEDFLAINYYCHAKCDYKYKKHKERLEVYKDKCEHKELNSIWTTIAGEDYVKEPSHYECNICGKIL